MTLTYEMLGKRIRQARREAGLTQNELAAAIGSEQGTVSRMEGGTKVSILKLAKIAWATAKSLDWFLKDEPVGPLPGLMAQAKTSAQRAAVLKLERLLADYEWLLTLDPVSAKERSER